MKCVIPDNGDTCRRCQRSGLPCVFLPRANAATLPNHVLSGLNDGDFKQDVLNRLKIIEDCLGLSGSTEHDLTERAEDVDEAFSPTFNGLGTLWEAASVLEKSAPSYLPSSIWSKNTIQQLWSW